MKKSLSHIGVLGMHWGRRMAKDGSMTTSVRGKQVPMVKSVHGKSVQVNGRALSNKTRAITAPKIKAAKDFVQKYHNKKVKDYVDYLDAGGANGKPIMRQVLNVITQVSLAYVTYKALKQIMP